LTLGTLVVLRYATARRLRQLAVGATCGACLLLPACNTAKSRNAEGVAYFQHGHPDYALQTFQQAQAQDPNNPNVYYNIARVYHHKGNERGDKLMLEQAESYYHMCLDRDPEGSHRDCYRALAVLLVETKREDKAFTLLSRWAAAKPMLADPKIELARLHEEHQDFEVAKERLLEAILVEPNNPRALAALGKAREQVARKLAGEAQQRELAQALADYRRSLQIDKQQPDVAARVAVLQTMHPRLDARLLQPDGRRMVSAVGTRQSTTITPRL
jgi:tetratricopeptide (TPR) repeat protein